VPLTACGPFHAPLAVHELAWAETHVNVALVPTVMLGGLTARLTVGTGGGIGEAPVPINAALTGPPAESLATVSVPVRTPPPVGVKVTLMLQLAVAASVAPQSSDC
jgi:hypothetical protein